MIDAANADKNREYGHKLREARKAEGYTQDELAEVFGVSTPTVSRMEVGNLTPTMLAFLVLFFIFMSRVGSFTKAAEKVKRIYPLTGKRLKRIREDKLKLSVSQLAAELKVTSMTVNRWERGIFDSQIGSYKWLAFELEMLEAKLAKDKKEKAA